MVKKDLISLFRKFAFLVFLVMEMFIGWKNFQYIKSAEENASEPVAVWESRLIRLQKTLPPKAGVVGYISDPDVFGYEYDPNTQIAYVLTQYSLAPVIINKGIKYEWIIGILSNSAYEEWVRLHRDEFEITFLKYNIYLIHRLNK